MHVQFSLESPQSTWTNLDVIRGKVLLRLFGPTPLSAIVVKLEGESKTRLRVPPRGTPLVEGGWEDWGAEKAMIREETHKILYRTSTVFPSSLSDDVAAKPRFVTLSPGSFEFPFTFKIPFNNACREATPSAVSSLAQVARHGMKGAVPLTTPVRHVKRTLPPTLTTFPGLAEIRYYIKVTVNRKEFYKENPRVVQNLNFFPIEPPRGAPTGAESYARRQHDFAPLSSLPNKGKNRLFDAFKKTPGASTSVQDSSEPPMISIDVRLPTPAIITCNEDLPMRIVLKRLNASSEPLFLQSLHIQLHGTTRIKANEIFRDESSNWVVVSKSNMGLPLQSSKAKEATEQGEEIILDSGFWRKHPLPNSVSPSFETCNISRSYELEVHVGIGFRFSNANNTVILPMRHAIQVYSGIAPPAALLEAMSNNKLRTRKTTQPVLPIRPEKSDAFTAPSHLRTNADTSSIIPPTSQAGPSTPLETPSEPSEAQYAPLPSGEEEPPPSYEDAIATDMPAVGGPRRDYQPPPMAPGGFSDEKGRRDS